MTVLHDDGFYTVIKETDCLVIIGQGEDVTLCGDEEQLFLKGLHDADGPTIAALCQSALSAN